MQRVDVDLTIARPQPASFTIQNAKRLRFHVVPSGNAIEARIQYQGSDAIPINEPFTLENCSPDPWTKVWITNPAGSGTLVILATDGSEDFDDFLASGGALLTAFASGLGNESAVSHSFWSPNSTNAQCMIARGDGTISVASAGGLAGQSFDTTTVYYGGLTGSVLASAVALNGGNINMLVARILNTGNWFNALQTTATPFTKNPLCISEGGLWSFRTDWFLETPTIGVGGSLIAALGWGAEPGTTVAAAGVAGCRGVTIAWSNEFGDNNFHLISCDGATIARNVNTNINAVNVHRMVEMRFGSIAGIVVAQAIIDGVVRATLTDIGYTMAQLSLFPAGVFVGPRVSAYKIQAGQNGNTVRLHHAGYSGYRMGRIA